MMYPLVRELADDGISVVVSCWVLGLARQPYYRWFESPISEGQLAEAYLANAIHDARLDDPEFGYRFLAEEVRQHADHAGVSDRVVWRICRDNGWWSRFGKPKRRKASPPGAASHHDLVRRDFTADAPNRLWLADITEHRTDEGKLYVCAIKDVFSNRIVGWAIDERMKARLVVAAIEMAVARRDGDGYGDGDNAAMESFFAMLQRNILDRRRRRQARLGRLTPIEFEIIMTSQTATAA
jgi:putative transposase